MFVLRIVEFLNLKSLNFKSLNPNKMKTTNRKLYEAPQVEVIEIENQGVLCASGAGGGETSGFGAGTTNMNMQDGYGW